MFAPCLSGAAASQTDAVTAYKIPALLGGPVRSSVTIIDTPGFGDTRGLHFDSKIVDQMKRFFGEMGEHVNSLTGVCFVTPASAARLTESQRYVWDAILGLFGKDVADNILMCFTFADGEKPQALEAVKMAGIPMTNFCKFNNSALFVDPGCSETDHCEQDVLGHGKEKYECFLPNIGVDGAQKFAPYKASHGRARAVGVDFGELRATDQADAWPCRLSPEASRAICHV